VPFQTFDFALFFLLVFPAVALTPHRARWAVLLAASLVFFAALRVPALLVALAVVTITSYAVGLVLGTSRWARVSWLWIGIIFDLGVLAAFKLVPGTWFGGTTADGMLAAVGVSYFTFQGIAYLVDVYTGAQKPERHVGYFALYMAFFPKLLQGPIERAGDLLPQLRSVTIDSADCRAGAMLFAWGLFKKMVVADRAGLIVDAIYGSVRSYSGPALVVATYLFAVQLYCDFSGYTDMALGVARCFGIRLTPNFANPYSARSIVEFWRRWHISFSRWIFDYVFNPLQLVLRDLRTAGIVIGLILTFLVSGVWHGIGWTFVVWGLLHGSYMAVSISTRAIRKRWHNAVWRRFPGLGAAWQVMATVHLVLLSWVFFRAENLSDAFYVLTHLGAGVSGSRAALFNATGSLNLIVCGLGAVIVGWFEMNWPGERIENILAQPVWLRWPIYYAIAASIVIFGAETRASFIYFQF
jgi:D-alanyl-lipoteichoic acid acyltransferase DltB (MBOAT superfamily)